MASYAKANRRRLLWTETLEDRQLLAVDLAVRMDPISDAPEEANTRVVRIFNNGDSTATDAVIQLDLTAEFEDVSWSRRSGTAQVLHQPLLPPIPRPELVNPSQGVSVMGDINADGFPEYHYRKVATSTLIRGREGLDLESVPDAELDEAIAGETTWPVARYFFDLQSDINADGFDDFVIQDQPEPYILYGGPGSLVEDEPLKGSRVKSLIPGTSTTWLSNSGDFNGDGVDDLLFLDDGPEWDGPSSQFGRVSPLWGAQIVFGRSDLSDFAELLAEEHSVTIGMRTERPNFDILTSSFGMQDINQDGVQDVIRTQSRWTTPDRQLVILGGSQLKTKFYGGFSLDELNGENGYIIYSGEMEQATSPVAMEGTGDVFQRVTIPAGESVVYTVSGIPISEASGKLSASAADSSGREVDHTNNSINIDAPTHLVMNVESSELAVGSAVSFAIEISNVGGYRVENVEVLEALSGTLLDPSWTLETQRLFPETISGHAPQLGPGVSGSRQLAIDGEALVQFQEPVPMRLLNTWEGLGVDYGPIGDINGDGYEDFYIDGLKIFLGGQSFVNPTGFETENGTIQFSPPPTEHYPRYRKVTALGDVDGDDFDDLLLGYFADRSSRELTYRIVYGQANFATQLVGFRDFRNRRVSGPLSRAGDINNDGKDDLIGESQILLGGDLSVRITPSPAAQLRSIGDINQDGFDDLAAELPTSTHLILGAATLPNVLNSSELPRLPHPLGERVRDLNGDGIDDFVSYDEGLRIVLGDSEPLTSNWQVIESGVPSGRQFDVGDWNGDGIGDLAVAWGDSADGFREIRIHFGSENLFSPEPQLVITGLCEFSACPSIASGVDINQDGIEDILVGDAAFDFDNDFGAGGAVYAVLGRAVKSQSGDGAFSETFDISPGESLTLQITGIATQSTLSQSHEVSVSTSGQYDMNPFTSGFELVPTEPLPGDLDQNGTVGFADFLTLSQHFGAENASAQQGDLDDDGQVGFADFLIFTQHFGRSQHSCHHACPRSAIALSSCNELF